MNITITLQADSKLLNAIELIANAITATSTPAEPKKAAKMSVVKEEKAVSPQSAAAENQEQVAPADESLDIVKVRAIAAEASQAGKKEAIKSILKEMNVTRVTDLKEDQFSDFVAKIKAI